MRHVEEIVRNARGFSARRVATNARVASVSKGAVRLASGVLVIWSAVQSVPALGQCGYGWRPGDGLPGVDGVVHAMTKWDPDGDGPQQELLIAGGGFRTAGKVRANNIAAWDGSNWSLLGDGVELVIYSLTVFEGELIAGGSSYASGGANSIMRWNGTSWQSMVDVLGGLGARIESLFVFDTELVAAGFFDTINGVAANAIVRWDGKGWHPFDSELGEYATVNAMIEFQGELIIGGHFAIGGQSERTNIARWDGASWITVGAGLNDWIEALAVFDGELIAGGYLYYPGAGHIRGVAAWDGASWRSLGAGPSHWVASLICYEDLLIAVGSFSSSGAGARRIASWNGAVWAPLGAGLGTELDSIGQSLAEYQGNLVVGGYFQIGGVGQALSIAQWNGTHWNSLGAGLIGEVLDWTIHDGQLIAMGFTNSGSPLGYIARLKGEEWQLIWWGSDASVFDAETYRGDIVACGRFSSIGGTDAENIAKFDGMAWQQLGSGLGGSQSFVLTMTEHDGDLIVAGQFETAGGISANNIASWDGQEWKSLGTGLNGHANELIVFQGELIVSGSFSDAGGVSASRIARWNGKDWQPLGNLPGSYPVAPLTLLDDGLLAVTFDYSGEGNNSYSIFKWDGVTWTLFASGLEASSVNDIEVLHGDVFVTGNLSHDGRHYLLARWDGTEFEFLGEEFAAEGWTLQGYNGVLMVGGQIPYVGEGKTDNYYYARWGPDCLPGDMNCDGAVDLGDVEAFVSAMLEPEVGSDCSRYLANVNGDVRADGASRVDAGDIGAFVAVLTGM